MKPWRFLLPLGATAVAIACNLGGFWMGGPRQWWELVVSVGYLAVWGWFLATGPEGWQKWASRIWWLATAVCAAVCIVMNRIVPEAIGTGRVFVRLVICAGASMIVYLAGCVALRVQPLMGLLNSLRRR